MKNYLKCKLRTWLHTINLKRGIKWPECALCKTLLTIPDLGFGFGIDAPPLLLLPALGAGRGSFGLFAEVVDEEEEDEVDGPEALVVDVDKIDVEAVVGGSGGQ